jgi:ubiquinone/menaquinone biosynthesis C-methylase UbiE
MKIQNHNDTVRQAFTLQAGNYAANATLSDSSRLTRLVEAVNPSEDSLVLDVATGPGFVAEAFSTARMVVGIDITLAPLKIAKQRLHDLPNLNLQLADVSSLPFAEAVFDVVVSRLAIHHFENPGPVLGEMARVCRVNGIVAVEDIIVSEHPKRANFQNRFEKLRDSSHTKAQPLSRLVRMFADTGLEVENVITGFLMQDVETWFANAHTPTARAARARTLIQRDATEDLSGTQPFRDSNNRLQFRQRTAIVVGRKLR